MQDQKKIRTWGYYKKYPLGKKVCGVGETGTGKYNVRENKKLSNIYIRWVKMIYRCYSVKRQNECPTYEGCKVCDEWLNFQNFAEWFDKHNIKGFHIDKDILVKGNKIYSPETCCFVPLEINNIFQLTGNKNKILPGVTKNKGLETFKSKYSGAYLGSVKTKEEAFNNYKIAKENHIKNVAEKWKDKISLNIYCAMINYTVEETDFKTK